MALTLEEAQIRLSSIAIGDTEALKNLINELNVEASGSKTILYSGMGDDFSKNLSNNPDIRILEKRGQATLNTTFKKRKKGDKKNGTGNFK
jgi:hypothetical protein